MFGFQPLSGGPFSAKPFNLTTLALSDSVGSSDALATQATFNNVLADVIVSSDLLGSPDLISGGIFRQIIATGGSTAPLGFGGIWRQILASARNSGDVQLVMAGVWRKILCLAIPTVNNSNGPIPTFPTLPEGYPIKVSPVMDTIIGTIKSLREMRVQQQNYPIWDIEILFEELRDQTQNQTIYSPFAGYQQYMQLCEIWLNMYGTAGVFAFDCPWDNSRANQQIGIGDGLTYVFTVFYTWGTGSAVATVPVGAINAVTTLYGNGVAIPSNLWQIQRNKIVFIGEDMLVHPPATGTVLTMTFSFYYLARWVEDEQDFEEFGKDRWTVNGLKLRASPWF